MLLLEDDAMISSLVSFALEDMDVELVKCTTVRQAEALLSAGRFQLLLSDLMLPGESGQSFITRLRGSPFFDPAMRIAVFSAGLSAAVREDLAQLGVWRLMSKPAPIGELRACVTDAIAVAPATATPQAAATASAVDIYFEGNSELFEGFRQACAGQFPDDVAQGDAALAQQDFAAMRRLCHSLKTVLLTIGRDSAAELAKSIEALSKQEDAASVAQLWPQLREQLETFIQSGI
jgi:DNA-binding response OmpR family regulator